MEINCKLLLQNPPHYVTSVNNQSNSSNQVFGNPCGDDEDGCAESASGDDDAITAYNTNEPIYLGKNYTVLRKIMLWGYILFRFFFSFQKIKAEQGKGYSGSPPKIAYKILSITLHY